MFDWFTGGDSSGMTFGGEGFLGSASKMFGDLGTTVADNKDLIGGLVGTGADLYSNRKSRKAEKERFNKMFDFNARNVARTNRLEDERQRSIDEAYGSSQNFNF